MVFVLDNYDSFTYSLVQYLGELGADVVVRATTSLLSKRLKHCIRSASCFRPALAPQPRRASWSPSSATWQAKPPSLASASVIRPSARLSEAKWCARSNLMHGKTSPVDHDGKGVFSGLPTPLTCTRYHSLIVAENSLPADLEAHCPHY